jgi:outer membrane biosynthesis protein TonB
MPDGAIGNLRVTKHGSPSADEAARQAILRAAPFAHLPQGCNVPKQIDYDFSHSSHQDNPSFHWGIH